MYRYELTPPSPTRLDSGLKRPQADLDGVLAPREEAYDRREPDDLFVRHGWLFNAGFADLPERRPRDDFEGRRKAAAEAAQAALREIFDAHGWEGVMRLAEQEGNPGVVGAALARIGMPRSEEHTSELQSLMRNS